jgi:hypothetical protein
MTRRTKALTGAATLAAGLALVAGLLAAGQAVAASGTLSIGSATVSPGAERAVSLEALGVSDPGLGAWSIDITYDPAVVTPVDCNPQSGSVCNPAFGEDVVRVSGAAGAGLEGDTTLAVITFECEPAEGSSDLSLDPVEFADGTPGAPADITTTVVDGAVTCQAGGSGETIAIGDGEAVVGDSDTVELEAQNIPDPGLGAWTIDISYDSSFMSAVSCTADQGGICNPAFDDGVVRVTGANIDGVAGNNRLGSITFECDALGESALELTVQVLVDSTVGDPQDVTAATSDGNFACVEPGAPTAVVPAPTPTVGLVSAGSGGGSGGFDAGSPGVWLVAGLIGAGIAWLTAGLAGVSLAAVTNRGVSRLMQPFTRHDGESFIPRLRPRGDEDDAPERGPGRNWFIKPRR